MGVTAAGKAKWLAPSSARRPAWMFPIESNALECRPGIADRPGGNGSAFPWVDQGWIRSSDPGMLRDPGAGPNGH